MPIRTEFNIQLEDRPGTLSTICRALADARVNIVGIQAFALQKGKSEVHLLVDDPATAKAVLKNESTAYQEAEVVQAKLSNRPGELAHAAASLGDAGINIDYVYSTIDLDTNAPALVFGVKDARRAASILDQPAEAVA